LYVFINEQEQFTEFNDDKYLHWKLENIEYGNWNDGENGDGIFTHKSEIELTPVMLILLFFF
jgi:hypothetical protein